MLLSEKTIWSDSPKVLNGQVYYGCINPASDHYRHEILTHTKKIGDELAKRGVVGHFGIDFLTSCRENGDGKITYDVYAIEINLRQGGKRNECKTDQSFWYIDIKSTNHYAYRHYASFCNNDVVDRRIY